MSHLHSPELVTEFLLVLLLDHFFHFVRVSVWDKSINFHCYADGTLLYLSMKPDKANQLVGLQVKRQKDSMTLNFLLLTLGKTCVLLLLLILTKLTVFGPERLNYLAM